jgi:hypothetical protein
MLRNPKRALISGLFLIVAAVFSVSAYGATDSNRTPHVAAVKPAPVCYDGSGNSTNACPGTPLGSAAKLERAESAEALTFTAQVERGRSTLALPSKTFLRTDFIAYPAANCAPNDGGGFTCNIYEVNAGGAPSDISSVFTLPGNVNSGYIVLLENDLDVTNPANWSDVLVFIEVDGDDDGGGTGNQIQLFSKGCNIAPGNTSCFPSYETVTSHLHSFIDEAAGVGNDFVDYTVYTAGSNIYNIYSAGDICIRDTAHDTRFLLDAQTGVWRFVQCGACPLTSSSKMDHCGLTLTGVATVNPAGPCIFGLVQDTPAGLVLAKLNLCGGFMGVVTLVIPGAGQFAATSLTFSTSCACLER